MKANNWANFDIAYQKVNVKEYLAFSAKLDEAFKPFMVNAGDGLEDMLKVTKKFNAPGGRWSYTAGKANRAAKLGFALGTAVALFSFMGENAQAAASIASHDEAQLAKWDAFNSKYEEAIDEIVALGRLSYKTGIQLRDAAIAYGTAIKLDQSALVKVEAAMGGWIDLHLEQ